jgi:hypothetical protein
MRLSFLVVRSSGCSPGVWCDGRHLALAQRYLLAYDGHHLQPVHQNVATETFCAVCRPRT